MRVLPSFLILACGPAPSGGGPLSPGSSIEGTEGGLDTATTPVDTGSPEDTGDTQEVDPPAASVDVLVIGAGPAGLAAAWEAREAGASVLLLEMEEQAGGGGLYASNYLAVGHRTQVEAGIDDSLEVALAEWPEFTEGEASDPTVQAFLEGSAGVIDWLEEEFGLVAQAPHPDPAGGSTPRVHEVLTPELQASGVAIVPTLALETWLHTRADALVTNEEGRVIGARATDLDTGESEWFEAGAVVMATGGFARNQERIEADRPFLADVKVAYEIHQSATGLGLPLLEDLDAQMQNQGHLGVYVHSVADFREGFEGEALWLGSSFLFGIILDEEGDRVVNEQEAQGFALSYLLADQPQQRLWLVQSWQVFQGMLVVVPTYNRADREVSERVPVDDLLAEGTSECFETMDALAAALGADPEHLASTIARYDSLAQAGVDEDFGKPVNLLQPMGEEPLCLTELVAGPAKSFTGVALDGEGRVIDQAGEAIPGLYAAGEVAGMLGTDAIGIGFSGSICAVYWTGRRAGSNAAAEVLGGDLEGD